LAAYVAQEGGDGVWCVLPVSSAPRDGDIRARLYRAGQLTTERVTAPREKKPTAYPLRYIGAQTYVDPKRRRGAQ
jgi:hypothetical protein